MKKNQFQKAAFPQEAKQDWEGFVEAYQVQYKKGLKLSSNHPLYTIFGNSRFLGKFVRASDIVAHDADNGIYILLSRVKKGDGNADWRTTKGAIS